VESKRQVSPGQISILAPHWAHPALIGPDRTFQVVVRASLDGTPALRLSAGAEALPVRVVDVAPLRPGLVQYTCATAAAPEPGALYALEVQDGGARAGMPRAASVLPRDTSTLALLHCADLHLLLPVADVGMVDRSALLTTLVNRINVLRPDLVVCTGDVISRYDERKRALPARTIRWQIRQAVELLAPLEVPLYVTLGNHDAAFEATRGDWYAAMGGGWNGGTDEYSLDWGRVHLAMLDCYAHYDEQNVQLRSSFAEGQLAWLRADLASTPVGHVRLVFAHYDYHKQLPPLLPELRIDALFYGHAKGLYPDLLAAHGIWDGHLADTMAYNLVRLTPEGITSEKVSWESLGS
jgi:hypothetical protein